MRLFNSRNERESLTARALRMPRRRRSWMSRSTSSGATPRARGSAGGRRLARRTFPRGTRPGSATIAPRDRDSEGDVEAAEARGHDGITPRRRAMERAGAEEHEAHSHDGNYRDREETSRHDSGSVERKPESGQPVRGARMEQGRRQERGDRDRKPEAEREFPSRLREEREIGGACFSRDRPDGDQERQERLRDPYPHPAFAGELVGRNPGGGERGEPDQGLPFPGDGGEGPGSLDRA